VWKAAPAPVAAPEPVPIDAYREAASRGASSASTQDGIAAETTLPAPVEAVAPVPTYIEYDPEYAPASRPDESVTIHTLVTGRPYGVGYAFSDEDPVPRDITIESSNGETIGIMDSNGHEALAMARVMVDALNGNARASRNAIDEMREEMLSEIDGLLQGTPYWQGGRFDTIKHLLARAAVADHFTHRSIGEGAPSEPRETGTVEQAAAEASGDATIPTAPTPTRESTCGAGAPHCTIEGPHSHEPVTAPASAPQEPCARIEGGAHGCADCAKEV